jgi:hypothetical protein
MSVIIAHMIPNGKHTWQIKNLMGIKELEKPNLCWLLYIINGGEKNGDYGFRQKLTMLQRDLADIYSGTIIKSFIFGMTE